MFNDKNTSSFRFYYVRNYRFYDVRNNICVIEIEKTCSLAVIDKSCQTKPRCISTGWVIVASKMTVKMFPVNHNTQKI